MQPNQLDRLPAMAGGRDQLQAWLLVDQIDKRFHEFWMVADDDNSVRWNNSTNPRPNVSIKGRRGHGPVSSYQQLKLLYVNCDARLNAIGLVQSDVIRSHENRQRVSQATRWRRRRSRPAHRTSPAADGSSPQRISAAPQAPPASDVPPILSISVEASMNAPGRCDAPLRSTDPISRGGT